MRLIVVAMTGLTLVGCAKPANAQTIQKPPYEYSDDALSLLTTSAMAALCGLRSRDWYLTFERKAETDINEIPGLTPQDKNDLRERLNNSVDDAFFLWRTHASCPKEKDIARADGVVSGLVNPWKK